jgi:hypothetical protein
MQYLIGVIRFEDGVGKSWFMLSQRYCITYAIVPSFGILQVIWNTTYETMDFFYNEGITQKYVNSSFNWIAQTFGLQLQYPHNISI